MVGTINDLLNDLPTLLDEVIRNQISPELDYLASVDDDDNPEYVGYAEPGTASSAAKWQIRKVTYEANTDTIVSVKYAGGSAAFDKAWDDRDSYTY